MGKTVRGADADLSKSAPKSHNREPCRGELSAITAETVMASALPLDSARIVMWNIVAKMHMAG
jgi:hypothetical protein